MTSLRAALMLVLLLSVLAAWMFFGASSNGVSFREQFRRELAFLVGTSVSVLPNEVNTAAERLKESASPPASLSSGGGGGGGGASASTPAGSGARPGDFNKDTRVDLVDFSILLYNWGKPTQAAVDLNGDGRVDLVDFSILLYWWTG